MRPPRAARRPEANTPLPPTEPEYYAVPTENGAVRVHAGHGKEEKRANLATAKHLAEKHGYVIDLLPVTPTAKTADAYNWTLGKKQEFKDVGAPTGNAVQKQIRSAYKQADSIVLDVKVDISLEVLRDAINNRVRQYGSITDVTIIMGGKDVTYSRGQITACDFKIKREDFK